MNPDYVISQMEGLTEEEMFAVDGGGWFGDFIMDVAEKVFVVSCGAIGAAVGTSISGGTGFATGIGAGVGVVAGQKIWDAVFE